MGKINKKLCGTLMIYNGICFDYCYKEAIRCLISLCDYVVVVDCGSTDGTAESLKEFGSPHLEVIYRDKSEWEIMKGREKLAYYTNIAIDRAAELGYEWQINLQADEIISHTDFPAIREAINHPINEGYWSRRINLWANSKYWLNVAYDRLPVGIEIIRLTKTKYHSVGDAQSIDKQDGSWEYLDKIRFWHMGFIRDKYKHVEKIENMLCNIFEMGMDEKVKEMGQEFNPFIHFSREDISPIEEPLPIFIQEWAKQRDEINGIIV